MNIKKLTSLILSVLLTVNISGAAFASVLGSSKVTGYTLKIGEGAVFSHNVFFSDQNGVGKQTENYITYSPNASITPIITNGNALYGTTTISKELDRLKNNGINIVGGINADFFSLQTGVPMSNLIVDGKIVTKDASGQDSIGILEDGTAFMSYVSIASNLIKEDGTETPIYNINKYRQPYAIYMMTEEFSDTTKNSTPGIDVILGSVEGEMKLGTVLEATVESISENDGPIEIPKGKIVLTVDKNAPAEFLDPVASLTEGERVKISFGVMGDKRWHDVKLGMGSVGGKLLTGGKVNTELEKGAAPRTALGIKEDGSLLLYTIDGRQTGYSYGVQLTTLAERMKELGCIEAINLDGGGSTSIVSLLPGESAPTLKNSPSDGKERGVATFLFLQNNLEPTGELGTLTFYPLNAYMLKGSSMQFELKAADTAYYPMELPENIKLSVDTDGALSEIDRFGVFTAKDSGVVRIRADYRGKVALMDINILETPTDIKIKNEDNEYLSSIKIEPGESIKLFAEAYGGYNILTAENENFIFEVDESLGTITEDGVFTANDYTNKSGNITVSAGEKTISIPCTVSYTPDPMDKENYPKIKSTLKDGMFEGVFTSERNMSVLSDEIKLYADGNTLSFTYDEDEQTLSAEIPEGASRLTLYATNTDGFTSFFTTELEKNDFSGTFEDTKGHWAEDILGFMYKNGIITGENTDEGLIFRPQKEMNRAEFSVMMCNYLKIDTSEYENSDLPFDDKDEIPKWAQNSIKALYDLGILSGKTMPDGTLISAPLSSLSRAEAATIIARTLPDGFFPEQFMLSDMEDIPSWAEKGINTLMSLGAMRGYTDGTLKPLNFLTKAEAAKLLYSVM